MTKPNTKTTATADQFDGVNQREPKKRRGLFFWGVIALIVILLVVLLAPTIVTRTSAREYLLAKAIPKDAASVSVQKMNAGWFTPVQIEGLQVLDAAGKPLVDVAKASCDRTLLQLAKDYTDLGNITVDSPTVHLSLRPDGSNLEDTLAKLTEEYATETTDETATTMVAATIQVNDAQILAIEEATGAQWALQQFNATASLPKAAAAEWVVKADGNLNGKPFAIETATPLGLATEAWPLGPTGNLKIVANQLPLDPLRYAALRSGQPIEHLTGFFSANASATWTPTANGTQQNLPKLEANGAVRADHLQLAAESLIGKDVLQLAGVQVDLNAQLENDVLNLQQCTLQSDFGRANLQTAMSLSHLSDPNAIIAAVRKQRLQSSGQIDVAAVTRTLPNTLKIHDDVQVANGQLVWNIESVPNHDQQGQTRWSGKVETKEVQILRNQKPIEWEFPLTIDFAVLDGQEIEVENVLAESDFFKLSGHGKLREGSIQANANLERLVYEIGQVVDLGGLYVNGGMRSVAEWSETQPNQLRLNSKTLVNDFVMAQQEQLICKEKEFVAVVDTTATLDQQTVASLDSGRLEVTSANDVLVAELQSPVAKPSADSTWPVLCRVKGGIETWFARAKTLGVGQGWQAAGTIDATTLVHGNQRGIAVQKLVVDARNVEVVGEGIRMQEPVIQLESAGTFDLATFASRFPSTTLVSQTVAVSANNVSVDMEPHFVVAGDVGYRANIERLMSYTVTDPAAATTRIAGEATGRLHLEAKTQTTTFQLTGDVANLLVEDLTANATASGERTPIWQEPKVSIETAGTYDAVQDQLKLDIARIVGKVVNLVAQGSATQLTSTPVVDVSGEYGYQLEGLLAIFRDMVGSDIQLTGNQTQRFAIQGPLFPAENEKGLVSAQLMAQAGVGWDTADVYSMALGPTQVDTQLQQGQLRTSPVQLAIGEGQVNVSPTIHLNTDPLWMVLAPATVVDHVKITPEMTKTWMKYVTPLLADATNAEGAFSVSLSRAEIPLVDPMQSTIDGQFIVHGGALGPGPLATQFIELATQIKRLTGQGQSSIARSEGTWVDLGEQNVTFKVAENRVYHENFEMRIDGVPIRTRGSVGMLDESINVMAEVPILDKWIERTPALAGLKGQVISIPVGGTTSRPQLDRQALAQATRQIAQQAATGAIRNEVGKQLQKRLGVGTVQDAIGGTQEKLNNKLQDELSKGLNKLFK